MMREEFDKTTFSTNPVADEGSGGATFTKRFQDDDEGYAFAQQCEEKLYDGQIAIRPLRITPIGTVQPLSKNDLSFLKFAEREQIRLHFLQTCPKRRWTFIKKKKVESKSYLRYQAYKEADTVQEMIALSIAARPRGISCREAKRVAIDDLKWDFERGYVVFPGNESRLPGHIFDAVELAREYSLKCYSQELEEQSKTYAECMATLEYPDTVD